MIRHGAWLLVLLALAGCRAPVVQGPDAALLAAQAGRERALADQPDWALQGRIAVSDGRDGGSGQVEWRQRGDALHVTLRAPVSGQGWQLDARPGEARLDGLDDGPREDRDAERLLADALGWHVPLSALSHWARGARAPGPAQLQFDGDGLPLVLRQQGWTIEYRGWDRSVAPPLPSRVFASAGAHRVRLVIAHWTAPAP